MDRAGFRQSINEQSMANGAPAAGFFARLGAEGDGAGRRGRDRQLHFVWQNVEGDARRGKRLLGSSGTSAGVKCALSGMAEKAARREGSWRAERC